MTYPILWHSNAPFASTGYGNQTALFVPRFTQAGYDAAISAFYGLNGAMLIWNGIRIFPGGYTPYGVDILPGHAASHFGGNLENGLVITLVDAWVLDAPSSTRMNLACWAPIDHEPAPPHVLDFFHASQAVPLAMTRHAEQEFRAAGLDPIYVPHGVDCNLYYPEPDRAATRRELSLPENGFLVGMVAANKGYPSRKGFTQAIEAFSRFRETHSDAVLCLHTEMQGHIQGVNIEKMLAAFKVPNDAVIICDPYRYLLGYPSDYMRKFYSSLDVLLNPAYGEGFGIPQIEAAACGTPVVATDWTAMREIAYGWKVGGELNYTDQRSFMLIPHASELLGALEEAYEKADGLRLGAREHALAYDADHVTQTYWLPALERLGVLFDLGQEEPVELLEEAVA